MYGQDGLLNPYVYCKICGKKMHVDDGYYSKAHWKDKNVDKEPVCGKCNKAHSLGYEDWTGLVYQSDTKETKWRND